MALESSRKTHFNQIWNLNCGVCRKQGNCFFRLSYQIHLCQPEFFRSSHSVLSRCLWTLPTEKPSLRFTALRARRHLALSLQGLNLFIHVLPPSPHVLS